MLVPFHFLFVGPRFCLKLRHIFQGSQCRGFGTIQDVVCLIKVFQDVLKEFALRYPFVDCNGDGHVVLFFYFEVVFLFFLLLPFFFFFFNN